MAFSENVTHVNEWSTFLEHNKLEYYFIDVSVLICMSKGSSFLLLGVFCGFQCFEGNVIHRDHT